MRSFRLFALMLVMAAVGCAQSRLFSRSGARDDDEPPPQSSSAADESPLNAARDRELEPRASGLNRELIRPQASSLPIAELLERAEQARQAARWPEVQRYSEAIIQQQPAHPRAHHLLAVIADLEGRFGDAEHHYNAALQSDPQNAVIIGDLGYSYLLQGRLALAEQYLLRARAIDPGNANVSKNLAVLSAAKAAI
ncbi:MAG: tetratricopeptide repeat protein [Planctomycetaceae bacterium]